MTPFDDLPLIRCRPTPSDTELAAERDAQHATEVARWITRDECQCPQWPVICHCAWPMVGEVLG